MTSAGYILSFFVALALLGKIQVYYNNWYICISCKSARFHTVFCIQAKYTEPHCDGKQVMVHLFEWPHEAVARECEEVLGPKGFCGVQVFYYCPVKTHSLLSNKTMDRVHAISGFSSK